MSFKVQALASFWGKIGCWRLLSPLSSLILYQYFKKTSLEARNLQKPSCDTDPSVPSFLILMAFQLMGKKVFLLCFSDEISQEMFHL